MSDRPSLEELRNLVRGPSSFTHQGKEIPAGFKTSGFFDKPVEFITPPEPESESKPLEALAGAAPLETSTDSQQRQQEVVRQELARRELMKRKLLPFVVRFVPEYQAGWIHQEICEALERFVRDVQDKKSPRLMINVPPRIGKSQIASICFPAWFLGNHPKGKVIAASYNVSLSMEFSRPVRDMIRSPEYQVVFPETRLNMDDKSAESWKTTAGGAFVASGVSSGITGKGADIAIIDDPVKDFESSQSRTAQEAAKNWFSSTLYTRLAPGGGICLIMTRWNMNDLGGWLESRMNDPDDLGADNWEILKFPAVALEDEAHRKAGEVIHPERYTYDMMMRIKANLLPRDWQALYQQSPVPDDGEYFTRDMFNRRYDNAPPLASLRVYAAWDLAIGQNEANDYTVGSVVGIDTHDVMYVLEVRRGRWDSLQITEQILEQYLRWKPGLTGIEKGQLEMAIGPILRKRMKERKLFPAIKSLPTGRRDKEMRARSLQGRMQQGMVAFPKHAVWMDALISEFLTFPVGVHDDQVDSLSHLGLMLDGMVAPARPKPLVHKSWKDRVMPRRRRSAMSA